MAYIIPEYEFDTLDEAVKYCYDHRISKIVWNGMVYYVLVDGKCISAGVKFELTH